MKILVTGAGGLLGSNLCKYLRANGEKIITVSKNSEADYNCDFTNREEVAKTLDKIAPDLIVDLIALVSVDDCEKNPNKAFLYNFRTAENIALWAKGKNTKIIYISTDHVYNGKGYQKEYDVNIVNTYAKTKYQAEQVLLGIGAQVLRTNFFGYHTTDPERGFFAYIMNSFKASKHFYISEEADFNPIFVDTCCEYIHMAIKNYRPGIFNIGSRNGFSKNKFIRNICKICGFDFNFMITDLKRFIQPQSSRPVGMKMDCTLFEETYGIKMPELENEIQKALGTHK